jgi:hypothetical protein
MPRKLNATAEKLKKDGVHIAAIDCSIPGVYLYEATHPDYRSPVGTAYCCGAGSGMMEILFLFTMPTCRGAGVGSTIVRKIQEDFPAAMLITSGGTSMGKPFMRATGWKIQDPYGWVYIKENDRPKRNKRKSASK